MTNANLINIKIKIYLEKSCNNYYEISAKKTGELI